MRQEEKQITRLKDQDYLMESWKRRIIEEKGCSEVIAERIAKRVRVLADYMQYGHAVIAFYKQDGSFQLVTGTLLSYSKRFGQPYDIRHVHGTFVYWNMEANGWRTFQIENFLEWKAIV